MATVVASSPAPDLLVCAERPTGMPLTQRVMSPADRAALERVFPSYGQIATQLDRLINWFTPGACPTEPAP